MKSAKVLIAGILVAVLLSGCGAKLDSSKLSVRIDLGESQYSLVGDNAVITAVVDNENDSNATYALKLEARNEADQWVVKDQSSEVSGSVSQTFAFKVEEAGTHPLRVSVVSGEKVLMSSMEATLVAKDLKSGVRTLFYDERIACEQSRSQCLDFQIKSTYPGLVEFNESKKKEILARYTVEASASPDLSTISADPEWLYPVTCDAKYIRLDVSKPLPGRTYIVEKMFENKPITVHITYLKGKFYFYPGYC